MSKVIALIPARSGSKGVPNKNTRHVGGHALIEWSISACKKSKHIDRVIVSTDSIEYQTMCRNFGAEVPFLRPAEISGDRSTDYEFVLHALDWLSANGGEPDYIVHIRPTTPLRAPELIDAAIESFLNAGARATALRSVHEMAESAYKTFEIGLNGQLKSLGSANTALDAANNARQGFPKTYIANGYVDVLSTAFIRQHQLLHGDHVIPFVTPTALEVDVEDDFNLIEYQLTRAPTFSTRLFG
jgi:CMP-N,N'-diacetyllegionaminic acid synthase